MGDLLTVSGISGPSEGVSEWDRCRGPGRAERRHAKGDVGWGLGEGPLEYDGHHFVPHFTNLLCKIACSSVSLGLSYSSVKLGS